MKLILPKLFVVIIFICLSECGAIFVLPSLSWSFEHSSVGKTRGYFTQEQIDLGKRYNEPKYTVFFISFVVKLAILTLIVLTGLFTFFIRWIERSVSGLWPVSVLLGTVFLILLVEIVSFPFSLFLGYFHEHAYGLSRETFGNWLSDYMKAFFVGVVISSFIVLCFYFLMRHFPNTWPFLGAVTFGLISIVLVNLAPLVIDPLFNKFTPLADSDLKQRIMRLAGQSGMTVDQVYEMDASKRTEKVNAYFTGLGNTKRIVIFDTLIRKSTRDEVEMVLAHEIGHWKYAHIWKGIGLGFLGSLIFLPIMASLLRIFSERGTFGLGSPADPASLAVVLLAITLVGFLILPIDNSISRYFEGQADLTSLELTRNPKVFIEGEKKLAVINLSDVEPNRLIEWLLFTHPSTIERIEMAERFGEKL